MKQTPTPLDYAAWRESWLGKTTQRLERELILELVGSERRAGILDVGGGDGTLAVALAAQGARVTALDLSIAALRSGARRAAESRTPIALVAGDASKLPFDAETFDLAVAVLVLCFVPSPRQVVEEIARVLRPGGRAIIGDLGRFSTWAAWRTVRGWFGDDTCYPLVVASASLWSTRDIGTSGEGAPRRRAPLCRGLQRSACAGPTPAGRGGAPRCRPVGSRPVCTYSGV